MPGFPRRTYPDGLKECVKCHAILPLSAFSIRTDRVGQWRSRCKECCNAPKRTGPRQFPPAPESKVCLGCGRDLPIAAFRRRTERQHGFTARCKECLAAARSCYKRRRPAKPPTPEQTWAKNVRQRGLTVTAWLALLAQQGGVCACCAGPTNGKGRFHIDHDHVSGRVRGLLCHKCNVALGLLDEDIARLERAIAYLTGPINIL